MYVWAVDHSGEESDQRYTINNVWRRTQSEILAECKGRSVRAGGDARCCSPGHSAKFGSYTIMDLETGNVLAVELVQSNEVRNSNAMELEGMKRTLAQLDRSNVQVSDLTADRHVQVRKYLCEERKDINHWFDGWHLAKIVKKKLLALGKNKGCEAVMDWAHSISNHMYFCAATSNGDGVLVEQKWLSILNHMSNKHEGHGDRYPRHIHREWIQADYIWQRYIPVITPGVKDQAITKDGKERYSVSYPKYKAGHHVVKPVKEECSYEYVDELLEELLNLRQKHRSLREAESIPGTSLSSATIDKHCKEGDKRRCYCRTQVKIQHYQKFDI